MVLTIAWPCAHCFMEAKLLHALSFAQNDISMPEQIYTHYCRKNGNVCPWAIQSVGSPSVMVGISNVSHSSHARTLGPQLVCCLGRPWILWSKRHSFQRSHWEQASKHYKLVYFCQVPCFVISKDVRPLPLSHCHGLDPSTMVCSLLSCTICSELGAKKSFSCELFPSSVLS